MSRAKRVLRHFRKQMKGIISLFLALTLLPFSSFAVLITESARYQNAVELLEEIIDGSAFSSVADYDSYLEKRFDLLATGQETDVSENFQKYMNKNMPAIGKNATLKSAKAEGKYALSDADILKAQIMEVSGTEVTIEFIEDVADIDELLKQLKKSFGGDLKTLNNTAEAVNKTEKVVKNISEVVNSIAEMKQEADYYYTVRADYKTKGDEFEKKVLQIPIEIQKAEEKIENDQRTQQAVAESASTESTDSSTDSTVLPSPTPTPIETDPYKHDNVKEAVKEAEAAAGEFKSIATTFKTRYNEYSKKLVTMNTKIKELPKKIDEARDAIKKLNADTESVQETFNWADSIMEQTDMLLIEDVSNLLVNRVNEGRNRIDDLIEALRLFKGNDVTKTWTHDTLVQKHLVPVEIKLEPDNYESTLNTASGNLDSLSREGNSNDVPLTDLLDVMQKIVGINFLYDSNLNAYVQDDVLFVGTNVNVNSMAAIESMKKLISAGNSFGEAMQRVASPGIFNKLVGCAKMATALADLLIAIGAFIVAMVAWAVEFAFGISHLLADGMKEGFMKSLILSGYVAYNLPNRTNYQSGKSLNGYNYSEIFGASGGEYGASLSGSLDSDFNAAKSNCPDSNMFRGAEAEYVLIGSQFETENQIAASFNLYMVRLLMNAWLVLRSGTATTALGVASWIIKIVILLVEPMLDVVILQNGGKLYLVKKKLFLSPEGIPALAKALVDVSDLYGGLKKHINSSIENNTKASVDPYDSAGKAKSKDDIKKETDELMDMKGLFMMDYTDYMLLMTLFMTDIDTRMKRLQNIIQMEAITQERAKNSFTLEKAYTYIRTEVEAELNPMFKIDQLAKKGIFTVSRTQYIGY